MQGELSPRRPSRLTSHVTWKSGVNPGRWPAAFAPCPPRLSSAGFSREGAKGPTSRKSSRCQPSRCRSTIWDAESRQADTPRALGRRGYTAWSFARPPRTRGRRGRVPGVPGVKAGFLGVALRLNPGSSQTHASGLGGGRQWGVALCPQGAEGTQDAVPGKQGARQEAARDYSGHRREERGPARPRPSIPSAGGGEGAAPARRPGRLNDAHSRLRTQLP